MQGWGWLGQMLLDWEEAGRRLGQAAGNRGQEGILAVTVAGGDRERTGSATAPKAAKEDAFLPVCFEAEFYPYGLYIHFGLASIPLECQDEDGPHKHLF